MGAGGDDLARPANPVSAVLGPGQGVAAGGERLGADEVLTAGAGQRDRLLGQLDPLGGAGQRGQRDRQPGRGRRPQRCLIGGQAAAGLAEQVDLLAVEQTDLEPERAGT